MRNIIGNPTEGDDFFDRPDVLAKLRRELDNLANILLVAPRRVGKTSLVLRLCEQWKARPKQVAVFLNVEGRTDELAFAEKLIEELAKAGLNPDILTRATGIISKIRQVIGGKGIKVSGLDLSLGEAADADHSTLSKVLESIFRKIDEGDSSVLIAIDELPVFLRTLQKSDDGAGRVTAFLHWLRELRQTYRKKIRWVFLGSIGLDTFVEDQRLHKTINDLQVYSLESLSEQEANNFLKKLGESNGLALVEGERSEIIRQLGWPLPHHLQLVFHEYRGTEPLSLSKAFDSLLRIENYSYFDTWHERIDEQFSPPAASACKAILGLLCKHPKGRKRSQILDTLMAKPSADVDKVEEQLTRLLIVLQRDGYLLESAGRYAFRSFLLREYWQRRHAP